MLGGSSRCPGVVGEGSCIRQDPGVRAVLPARGGPGAARGIWLHAEVTCGAGGGPGGGPGGTHGGQGTVGFSADGHGVPQPCPHCPQGMARHDLHGLSYCTRSLGTSQTPWTSTVPQMASCGPKWLHAIPWGSSKPHGQSRPPHSPPGAPLALYGPKWPPIVPQGSS